MLLADGMDKREQVGSAHECLSDLLHAIGGDELIAIACKALGISKNELAKAHYHNPRIEISGLSDAAKTFVVDIVYTLQFADRVIAVWVFEIELSWSSIKRRRWALFLSAYENELDVDGHLVVFSPKPRLRERIRRKAIPGCRATPLLIQPDHIERITDHAEARRRPRLTILGCIFHAQEPAPLADQVELVRAAWLANQGLPPREAQRYGVLVMEVVGEAAVEQGIEQLRESGELDEDLWDSVKDTVREGWGFNRGRAEGREEGRREALRAHLVDMLEVRGLTLTQSQRERIASCESLETLERWYAAAKMAAPKSSIDQLLS
jgi:hypothetical protein